MKVIIFILLCLLPTTIVLCNNKLVSITIIDAETNDTLADAIVFTTKQNLFTYNPATKQYVSNTVPNGHNNIYVAHTNCDTIIMHADILLTAPFYQTIYISHSRNVIDGIIKVGNKNLNNSNSFSANVFYNSTKQLKSGATFGESLQSIAGVTAIQTGNNIYKPSISGLSNNRIILVNNGIRQEGQQWGNEHAPEIDPLALQQVNVVYGAGTLMYGSDAIGGIILAEPKVLGNSTTAIYNIIAGCNTNGLVGYTNFAVEKASKKFVGWAGKINGTAKRGGNAFTPNYILANSGIAELNGNVQLQYKNNIVQREVYLSTFNTKFGIFSGAHIGNVTDLLQSINAGAPSAALQAQPFTYSLDRPLQTVQHHMAKYGYKRNMAHATLRTLHAIQYNYRNEYDKKKFASSSNAPQLSMGLLTTINEVHFTTNAPNAFNYSIGIQHKWQWNSSYARFFIPDYKVHHIGAYYLQKYIYKQHQLSASVRGDVHYFYNIQRGNNNKAASKLISNWSSVISYMFTKNKWQFGAGAASIWRTPSMNEWYSNGLHHGAARYEKGDSTITIEKGYAINTNSIYASKKFTAKVLLDYKAMQNFIYLQPSYPPVLTIRGAFPLFEYKQCAANIFATNAQAMYSINAHNEVSTSASILYAYNKTDKQWLSQMPSNRYSTSYKYSFANTNTWQDAFIKIGGLYVMEQTRVPTIGNIPLTQVSGDTLWAADYAPPPPAYTIFQVEASTAFNYKNNKHIITIQCNNLLNNQYKEYLNAFRYYSDEVGRNININYQLKF